MNLGSRGSSVVAETETAGGAQEAAPLRGGGCVRGRGCIAAEHVGNACRGLSVVRGGGRVG